MIGGCSAHNACIVVQGTPGDYDEWSGAGWSYARLEPLLRRAEAAIGTRRFADEELSAWHRAVLAAGAYSSPAILHRSGVGPAAGLRRLGVDVAADLPGVGANLADHAGVGLEWEPRPALRAALAAGRGEGAGFEAQSLVKGRSSVCAAGAWDLHVLPWLTAPHDEGGAGTPAHQITAVAFALKPASRGTVSLRSTDPLVGPVIDHGFLSDPGGLDRRAIADGVALARRLIAAGPLAELAGDELRPGANADLDAYVRSAVRGYFHPVGTCAMGPAGDPEAVVDGAGRVHGLTNLHVCDASIMPTLPRANTHLSVLALAEGIAEALR